MGLQSQYIRPSIQIKSKKPEVYSCPHCTPYKIPMGNYRMEFCHPQINTASPIVSKAIVVETQKQLVEVVVT